MTLGYRPELDAVRAAACGAVFVSHALALADQPVELVPGGGWVGVTMFFTLSGFLITTLMLEERDRTGRVRLGAFYLRRAKRLLPAILGLVAVCFVVAALVDPAPLPGLWRTLLYVGNLHRDMWWMGHTWSLAIEEHFYLAWPLVFLVARHHLLAATCALAGLSFLTRLLLALDGADWWRLRNGDDTRAEAILIGCALAIVIHQGWRPRWSWRPIAAALVPFVFLAGYRWVAVLGYTAVSLLTAALIASWRAQPPATPRFLASAAKVTYGFYLWHFPILLWMQRAWDLPPLPFLTVGFGLSALATWLSWVLLERRWLRLGDRLERDGHLGAGDAGSGREAPLVRAR